MSNISFDPERTLAGALGSLTPGEVIALGISLCACAEERNDGDFVGGIWPGNISFVDGSAAIGPYETKGLKEMGPDALEYIAPEQFWKGDTSPASDVYSIGLVLYTALNGGVMPFFEDKPTYTPEARAAALQKRMRGNDMVYPRSACRELGDVVLCATEFKDEDRFPCPAALRAALEALPEEASIPAVAPVIRLKPRELEATRNYRVDKFFERTSPPKEPKPQKRRATVDEDMDVKEFRKPSIRRKWIGPGAILLVIIIALALIIRGCSKADPVDIPEDEEPGLSDAITTESPKPQTTPDVVIDIPQPDPPKVEEPSEPSEPSFSIFVENLTWEQAKASCEAKGGHLAVVDSQERLDEIITLAQQKGVNYVWLGSYRGGDGKWYNVTGEEMSFSKWDTGEPSAIDMDGTREDYLLLWYRANRNSWTYNDMRNDPISVVPGTYMGKIAYVCQFD